MGDAEIQTYDENRILVDYVYDYFGMHMTEFEIKVSMVFHLLSKRDHLDPSSVVDQELEQYLNQMTNEPEVALVLSSGLLAFRRVVAERIRNTKHSEIFINRCPSCDRIVRTPKARQCLWCSHSWHGTAGRAVG